MENESCCRDFKAEYEEYLKYTEELEKLAEKERVDEEICVRKQNILINPDTFTISPDQVYLTYYGADRYCGKK